MAQLKNTTISDTGSLNLPAGTTAQRPTSPAGGQIRYNTTISDTEYYDGGTWRPISDSNPEATGGTVVDTDIGGVPYRIHVFTNTGNSTFAVSRGGEVEYLIVAGGGSGGVGSGGNAGGGGGGAGGLLTGVATVTAQSYTVTVGAGGAGLINNTANAQSSGGNQGSNSSALGLTAIGGGRGRSAYGPSTTNASLGGGSGGGGSSDNLPTLRGDATAGQGNIGAPGVAGGFGGGCGGGGAGSPGVTGTGGSGGSTTHTAGPGGHGIASSINGSLLFYAGGGGGGHGSLGTGFAPGGLGGGGRGGSPGSFQGTANSQPGNLNTGGASGGGSIRSGTGSSTHSGGSGIVIIRYRRNVSAVSNVNIINATLPNSSPTEFLVTENLVLNFDASNAASYLGQGTTIRNLADDTNNGTINGSLAFETAAPNHGTFNFTNNPFVATSNFFLGNGPTAWTLNAWVRTTTTVDALGQGAVASNASGGPVYSSIGINAGRISYWTYEGAWLRRIGNIVVNDNRWHMLTWVNYPNSTMAMYVDGILDVGNQRSVSGNNNPIDRFGGSWNGRFDGRISQITINLNRFLLDVEIIQTFNATRRKFGV